MEIEYHKKMNPVLWNDLELKPEVRKSLLKIADFFVKSAEIPRKYVKDIVITGSNANFNYTDYSDIDLHIILNIDENNKDLYKKYLTCEKKILNNLYDIKIKGLEVEVYFQLADESHFSSGVFSVLKNKWIIKPKNIKPNINVDEIRKKFQKILFLINRVIEQDEDYRFIKKVLEKIKKFRKSGLEKGGEFSAENIIFKLLRNTGIMKKLIDLLNKRISRQLSLENIDHRIDLNERIDIKKKDIRNMDLNSIMIGFEFEFLATVPMEKILSKKEMIEAFPWKYKQNDDKGNQKNYDENDEEEYDEDNNYEDFSQYEEHISNIIFVYERNYDNNSSQGVSKDILKYFTNLTKVDDLKIKYDPSVLDPDNNLNNLSILEYEFDRERFPLPLELVTPPLPFPQAIEILKKILETIRKGNVSINDMSVDFETTPTSGLHVNISVDPSSPYFKSLNANYLFTLGTLDYLLDIFDEKDQRIFFTKELEPQFMKFLSFEMKNYYKTQNLNELGKEVYSFLKKFLTDQENFSDNVKEKMKSFWNEKYKTIRVKKNQNYAEFRVLGGMKYEDKEDEIIRNILKFSFLVWESSIKEYTKFDEAIKRMVKAVVKAIETEKSIKRELSTRLVDYDLINKKADEILNFIRKISKKFEKHQNEIKKFIFMIMFYFKENLIKANDEKEFARVLTRKMTENYHIVIEDLDEKIKEEIFGDKLSRSEIERFFVLYKEMKKDKKFALKLLMVVKNALKLYKLDIKKVYEEISKK